MMPCKDCGVDTGNMPTELAGRDRRIHYSEFYSIKNSLWKKAKGGSDDYYLCVGCLERRIGRPLRGRDFTKFPVNYLKYWDTPRLIDRKLDGIAVLLQILDAQGAINKVIEQ